MSTRSTTPSVSGFLERLRTVICVKDLDLETAEALSKELHDAEQCGYQLSTMEDSLWSTLTHRILEARKK